MKLAPRIYSDLVGKPFQRGGRGPYAYDCLGLALELQRRQGRQVPDFQSTPDEFRLQHGPGVLGPALEIGKPRAGCAVLLRMVGGEPHIATMIDAFRMIHTMKATGSVVLEVLGPLWSRRVIGFYEPESQKA